MAVVSVAACSSPTDLRTQHRDAQERWAAEGPSDYTLRVRRACECLPEESRPAWVAVVGGAVVSRTYVETGELVPEAHAWAYPSAEEAFDLIHFLLTPQARPSVGFAAAVEVQYDASFGYPTEIRIIYAPDHVDGTVVVLLELEPTE